MCELAAPSLTTNSLALAMAAGSPLLTSEHSKKTKPNRRKRTRKGGEAEKLDSLKWNPSSSAEDNDPFAFLVGSNELDGGRGEGWRSPFSLAYSLPTVQ